MAGQLYTIPFSHYCELARWSLQEAKVSFVEYPYLPGVHTFFGPMQRLRAKKADSGSTGKGQGTPLYVAADGKILDDSWESLEVLGPVPEEMKKVLNYEIGPQVLAIVYADLLKPEKDAAFAAMGAACPVPWWQRWLWQLSGFRHKVSSLMREKMVGDEEKQAKTLQDFEAAIKKVEAELAKPDGCFKGAPETLTPPALALAALFAPAVCPPEYSGKFAPVSHEIHGSPGHHSRDLHGAAARAHPGLAPAAHWTIHPGGLPSSPHALRASRLRQLEIDGDR